MARTILIDSPGDVATHLATIERSTKVALGKLNNILSAHSSVSALAHVKFDRIGRDPLDPDRDLNFIEQVNQTFTYLATLAATKELYQLHPSASNFILKMGAIAGTDIESVDCGGIAAEVFSAVVPSNNDKLRKDTAKVAASGAANKYVFFMCPGYPKGKQPNNPAYPDVTIFSLGEYERDA